MFNKFYSFDFDLEILDLQNFFEQVKNLHRKMVIVDNVDSLRSWLVAKLTPM